MWQQEMAILALELSPQIAARMLWSKLWAELEKIPEEMAIGEE